MHVDVKTPPPERRKEPRGKVGDLRLVAKEGTWPVHDAALTGIGVVGGPEVHPGQRLRIALHANSHGRLEDLSAVVTHASTQRTGLRIEYHDASQKLALSALLDELAPPDSGVDASFLHRRFADKMSLFGQLVDMFRMEAPAKVQSMRSALDEGDKSLLAAEAHSLAGIAATMGAPRLRGLALALEQKALDGATETMLLAGLGIVSDELRLVLAELDDLRMRHLHSDD